MQRCRWGGASIQEFKSVSCLDLAHSVVRCDLILVNEEYMSSCRWSSRESCDQFGTARVTGQLSRVLEKHVNLLNGYEPLPPPPNREAALAFSN